MQKELVEVKAENQQLTNLVRVANPSPATTEVTNTSTSTKAAPARNCKLCGGDHYTSYCTAVTCTDCNEYGHTAYVCPKKPKPPATTSKSKVTEKAEHAPGGRT